MSRLTGVPASRTLRPMWWLAVVSGRSRPPEVDFGLQDSVVGRAGRDRFGRSPVGLQRSPPIQRPVWRAGVVVAGESVELTLQIGAICRWAAIVTESKTRDCHLTMGT